MTANELKDTREGGERRAFDVGTEGEEVYGW